MDDPSAILDAALNKALLILAVFLGIKILAELAIARMGVTEPNRGGPRRAVAGLGLVLLALTGYVLWDGVTGFAAANRADFERNAAKIAQETCEGSSRYRVKALCLELDRLRAEVKLLKDGGANPGGRP